MKSEYRDAIAQEFLVCVRRTIERVGEEDSHRPFHRALLSDDVLRWSRFERSFSTSFGQGVIERISKLAVLSNGAANACTQAQIEISISENKLNGINSHISQLRNASSGVRGSWSRDVTNIQSIPDGERFFNERVISDLWWHANGVDNFMSIKTVKPNIDQTAEAKRDLLKLKMAFPSSNVYFGLYYNPFGESKNLYSWAPPKKVFDFQNDPCVLIGREYWDTLGGIGFYDELLDIVDSVGAQARMMICA